MNQQAPIAYKPKDFATDQEVRWCPGCGDYAILKGVQKTLAEIGTAPENVVFVSGIGCAARFPYYIETYGFHTIHGRAPAVATGVKLANPDLDVWLVSGDGDAMSIGGNHMMHLLRRNIDVNYLIFNNEIYGLTKGQYSPTSRLGTRSPSTPAGSIDAPVSACGLARCRWPVRGPRHRPWPEGTAGHPEGGARTQGGILRRDPAELHRLQRRSLRWCRGQERRG